MSTGGIEAILAEMNWLHGEGQEDDKKANDGRSRDLHTPEVVTLSPEETWVKGEVDNGGDDGSQRDLQTHEVVTLPQPPTISGDTMTEDEDIWGDEEEEIWMTEAVSIPEPSHPQSSNKVDPPPLHTGTPQPAPSSSNHHQHSEKTPKKRKSTTPNPTSTSEIQSVLKKQKTKMGYGAPPKPVKANPQNCERCRLIRNLFFHGMKANSMQLCLEEILPYTQECFERKACKVCKKVFNLMKA